MSDKVAASRCFGIITGLAAEARIAAPLGTVAAGGGLPEGARRAAERLAEGGATALLSFGLCGGLDPALAAGALAIPRAVLSGGRVYAADPALCAALGGATCAAFLAGERVAISADEKAALFARWWAEAHPTTPESVGRASAHQPSAIDLESGAVAEVAANRGLPFAVLRAVVDPAGFSLPPAALAALDGAGRIAPWRVTASILRRPGQIPALLTLSRHAAAARAALVGRVAEIVGGGRAAL